MLIEHYRQCQSQYDKISDALSIKRFSDSTLKELSAGVGAEAARLIESIARLQNYGDTEALASNKRAVSELLLKTGTRLSPGKRPNVSLEALVEGVAPVLIFYGIPSASSERSRLVIALRLIAGHFDIAGDPRDQIRRLLRLQSQFESDAHETITEIFRDAMKVLISPNRNK